MFLIENTTFLNLIRYIHEFNVHSNMLETNINQYSVNKTKQNIKTTLTFFEKNKQKANSAMRFVNSICTADDPLSTAFKTQCE